MKINLKESKIESIETELLIIGTYENDVGTAKKIDEKTGNEITKSMKKKEFNGEYGQIKIINTAGKIKAKNILVLGLGKKENVTVMILKKAIGIGSRIARDILGAKEFTTTLHSNETKEKNSLAEKIQAVTEGILLGNYQFLKYKTQGLDKIKKLNEAIIVVDKKEKEYEKAVEKGKIIAESTIFVRDLVNEPGSELTPEVFAKIAEKEAKKYGIKITVLNKKEIEKKKLYGLLAVSRGSINDPRFLILEYKGNSKKSLALVGKGVTFDSGGLDLKSAKGMETMKGDMGGAATTLGAIIAAARLKLPVHIYGVIGLTENMPGRNAYKPGDVVKTYNGKTIEVLNTDAEGRVTLADSLTYAEKNLKPDVIIDLATLTGACVVALGSVAAAVVGDEKIVDKLKEASKTSGEKIWELPLWQEYLDQVKSDIADVRNIGLYAGEAGTITAAAFLKNFIDKTPWAHIDIAGTAFTNEEKELTKKGGTGWGINLLTSFLEKWK